MGWGVVGEVEVEVERLGGLQSVVCRVGRLCEAGSEMSFRQNARMYLKDTRSSNKGSCQALLHRIQCVCLSGS